MSKHSLTFPISAADELKTAFKEKRDSLMRLGKDLVSLPLFQEFVISKEEEYNCPEGIDRIRNVYYSRVGDYKLTNMMEEYATEIKQIKNL